MNAKLVIIAIATAVFLPGCATSYVNSPEGRAHSQSRREEFSHALIERAYHAKPGVRFPATVAIAPQNDSARQEMRALDAAGKLDSLKTLPKLKAIVNLSSLVFSDKEGEIAGPDGKASPIWNNSDLLRREAAARLHADIVLLIATETHVTNGKIFRPLTTLSLGLFPNDRSEIITTALAAVVDTRTGYVYGTAERSAGRTCHAMSWDDETRDRATRRTQSDAMTKLLDEIPALWSGIVAQHAK